MWPSSTRRCYGREPDRYEKASLVSFIEKQQKSDVERLAKNGVKVEEAKAAPADPQTAARAAAFVDLAHALANSNEFSYRF